MSSGVVGLAVGLMLCFLGVGSLHLAVLGSGFALGWLISGLFDANATVTVLVGLGRRSSPGSWCRWSSGSGRSSSARSPVG